MPKVLNIKSIKEPYLEAMLIDCRTLWGNPYIIGINGDRNHVCDMYLEWLNRWIEHKEEVNIQVGAQTFNNKWVVKNIHKLKGRDVVCWCAPERCHGEVLIRLANI